MESRIGHSSTMAAASANGTSRRIVKKLAIAPPLAGSIAILPCTPEFESLMEVWNRRRQAKLALKMPEPPAQRKAASVHGTPCTNGATKGPFRAVDLGGSNPKLRPGS